MTLIGGKERSTGPQASFPPTTLKRWILTPVNTVRKRFQLDIVSIKYQAPRRHPQAVYKSLD